MWSRNQQYPWHLAFVRLTLHLSQQRGEKKGISTYSFRAQKKSIGWSFRAGRGAVRAAKETWETKSLVRLLSRLNRERRIRVFVTWLVVVRVATRWGRRRPDHHWRTSFFRITFSCSNIIGLEFKIINYRKKDEIFLAMRREEHTRHGPTPEPTRTGVANERESKESGRYLARRRWCFRHFRGSRHTVRYLTGIAPNDEKVILGR